MSNQALIDLIDEFIEKTQKLNGQPVREREAWNNEASADAIRHFAYGIDDDNPLWLDPEYAAGTPHGNLLAPPAFLVSVLYPILHGAPMAVPLSSLIGGVEFEWEKPIPLGSRLRAVSIQKDAYIKTNKAGRQLIFIISECTYRNAQGDVLAKGTGTMIRTLQEGDALLYERPIRKYGAAEFQEIEAAYEAEERRGGEKRRFREVSTGDELPPMVRGPPHHWRHGGLERGQWPLLQSGKARIPGPEKGAAQRRPHPADRDAGKKLPAARGLQPRLRARDAGAVCTMASCASPGSAPSSPTGWGTRDFSRISTSQCAASHDLWRHHLHTGKVVEKNVANHTVKIEITGKNQEGELATAGTAVVQLPA